MPALTTADGADIKQGDLVWGIGGDCIKTLVRGTPSESGVSLYKVTEASENPILLRDQAGAIWRGDPSSLYASRWSATMRFLNQCVDSANTAMKSAIRW